MKVTLVTIVALVGAASAISVDAGLVKRQCIPEGNLCFTSIIESDRPCCGDLVCYVKPQPNTNICERRKRAEGETEELSKRSHAE